MVINGGSENTSITNLGGQSVCRENASFFFFFFFQNRLQNRTNILAWHTNELVQLSQTKHNIKKGESVIKNTSNICTHRFTRTCAHTETHYWGDEREERRQLRRQSIRQSLNSYTACLRVASMDALGTCIANSEVPLMKLYCTSPNSLHCHWNLIFTPHSRHHQQYQIMANKRQENKVQMGLITWLDRRVEEILLTKNQFYSSKSSALQNQKKRCQTILYTASLNLSY